MCGTKGHCYMQFNELQAVGLLLALDGASTHTDPFTSGKKYCTLAISIRNKTLFFVSAAATCAFQLEHTPQLLRSICPAGYAMIYRLLNCHVGSCGVL